MNLRRSGAMALALLLALYASPARTQSYVDGTASGSTPTGATAPGFVPLVRSGNNNYPNSSSHPFYVTTTGAGALPAGAATSALQTTGNTSLSSILSGMATATKQDTGNTSLASVDTKVGTTNTNIGAPGATVCATDTGSCSLNALFQRMLQRLTTLLAVFPTTIDTNSGSKSASTLRVVLATDQPALSNKLLVTPDANSAINLAQVGGSSVATGHGTASGAVRVELPTDGTGKVGLNAGSAVVGAFSTDQTTPETSDLVTVRYQRRKIISLTFTPGSSSYTIGQVIGPTGAGSAPLTVAAGIGNSQPFMVEHVTWVQPATSFGAIVGNALVFFADSALSGTYTDQAVPPITATDAPKIKGAMVVATTGGTASTTAYFLRIGQASTSPLRLTTDGSGNVQIFFVSQGTETWTAPGVASVHVQIAY